MSLCISDFVDFDLPGVMAGEKLRADELKGLLARIQSALNARGFDAGGTSDLIGGSTDIWMMQLMFDEHDAAVDIDVSPHKSERGRWNCQIALDGSGGTAPARSEQMAVLARIECAVHRVLVADLRAGQIAWHLRRTTSNVDDYFSFVLPGSDGGKEAEVVAFAARLERALGVRDLDPKPTACLHRDWRSFTVRKPAGKIIVGLGPDVATGYGPSHATPDRWSVQVYLDRGGWFRLTRQKRSDDFLAVEKAVRQALANFGARDISRLTWMGRRPARVSQPVA